MYRTWVATIRNKFLFLLQCTVVVTCKIVKGITRYVYLADSQFGKVCTPPPHLANTLPYIYPVLPYIITLTVPLPKDVTITICYV